MVIIYGLGNNDPKYLQTKHNAGRVVLEDLVKLNGLSFNRGQGYYYTKSNNSNQNLYYLYSAGYMNNSGQALAQFCGFYKLKFSPEDVLLILQDDSDQFTSNQKLAKGGGSAGHHGINDIYRHALSLGLGTEQIWRLKIGIRPAGNRERSETFVLKPFSPEESVRYAELAKVLFDGRDKLNLDGMPKIQEKINSLV